MQLWEMSISGGVLIVVILVLRRLFHNKVPKRTFLVLWTVAVVRLLVPVAVDAPWNLHSWLEQIGVTARLGELAELVQPAEGKADVFVRGKIGWGYGLLCAEYWNQSYGGSGLEYLVEERGKGLEKGGNQAYAENSLESLVEERGGDLEKDGNQESFPSAWTVIYFGGMLICAVFYLSAYLKYYREFWAALPKDDRAMQEWADSFGLKRKVQVRQSDLIPTPMTYGILHPVILLPKGIKWEDSQQIHFVLTHEMVHIQRFDVIRKFLLVAALCIHWWNPFVWVMYILANRDIELACDECVLQYFGQGARTDYALCLISLAERNQNLASCPACRLTGRIGLSAWKRVFGKDEMEERIVAIMKKNKPTARAMANAGILVVFVLVLFAASAFREETREEDTVVGKEQILADTKPVKAEKVADLREIGNSSGYIFLPVPKNDPAKIAAEEGLQSETVYEGDEDTGFLMLCQNIYHSEEYPEYEKSGLIYDEENGHFLYQGEIVGYFKDEMEPGLYRRFTDEEGTVGIVALRDESWNFVGFRLQQKMDDVTE